jgi:hypothetical protein
MNRNDYHDYVLINICMYLSHFEPFKIATVRTIEDGNLKANSNWYIGRYLNYYLLAIASVLK